MANHYEFPSTVILEQAGRAYLDKLTLSFAEPGEPADYAVKLRWLITDPNGSTVGYREGSFTSQQWQNFINGLGPGDEFESSVLSLTSAILTEAPPGGVVVDDAP
jgi:hypothetical protein